LELTLEDYALSWCMLLMMMSNNNNNRSSSKLVMVVMVIVKSVSNDSVYSVTTASKCK